jgi:hypothetical protein
VDFKLENVLVSLKTIYRFHKSAFDRGDCSFECFDQITNMFGLVDGVLAPLSAIFQLYHGEKTTDLSQVTDKFKLYHITLYRIHLAGVGFELTTLVVIDRLHRYTNYSPFECYRPPKKK